MMVVVVGWVRPAYDASEERVAAGTIARADNCLTVEACECAIASECERVSAALVRLRCEVVQPSVYI